MLPWIICVGLFVVSIAFLWGFVRSQSNFTIAQRDIEELRWRRDVLNGKLWSILSAFCRKDFLERRLLVSVERCDGVTGVGFECKAAPYGVEGSFWKFSIERVILGGGREAVRVGVSADVDGRHVSFWQEFLRGSDNDQFRQGERFIELAYQMDDRWRAYPHEQAKALIDAFFGHAEPPRATSCFTDAQVREAPAASDMPSTT